MTRLTRIRIEWSKFVPRSCSPVIDMVSNIKYNIIVFRKMHIPPLNMLREITTHEHVRSRIRNILMFWFICRFPCIWTVLINVYSARIGYCALVLKIASALKTCFSHFVLFHKINKTVFLQPKQTFISIPTFNWNEDCCKQ